MTPLAKLEKLLIQEVSGVDAPANGLDGWMLQKAAGGFSALPLGPDQPWHVGDAEARIRKATGADTAPTPAYAACFLSHADTAPADLPDDFGVYKFLVCDVVNDKICVMPQAISAAAQRLADSSLTDTNKASVLKLINGLEKAAGADAKKGDDAQTIVGKIKSLLAGQGKDDIDMTKDELTVELDSRFAGLEQSIAEAVAKSVEVAAPAIETEETVAETPEPGLTEDQVTKALTDGIETALQPLLEVVDKAFDRIERLEKHLRIATRKSLDGQESGAGETEQEATPTVKDAILKAFTRPQIAD